MDPMGNRNFSYILLERGATQIQMNSNFKEKWLDEDRCKALEKYHKMFRSGKEIEPEELTAYEMLI